MVIWWWWWWYDDYDDDVYDRYATCDPSSCLFSFLARDPSSPLRWTLLWSSRLLSLSKFFSIIFVQSCTVLCSSQFGGLVTSLLQISIVFNNLVSLRFQKFDNIPSEKLFSVVLTCFHFNFYSTLLLNFHSGFSNVTPSDWQVLLWCGTSFSLIMWTLL